MEKTLRQCCRSIRIGKMLVRHEEEDPNKPAKVTDHSILSCFLFRRYLFRKPINFFQVIYVKLPPDIAERNVLLMYPLMSKLSNLITSVTIIVYPWLLVSCCPTNSCVNPPFSDSGSTIHQSIRELKKNAVPEDRITICTLFVTPDSVNKVLDDFPNVSHLE